MALFYGMLMAMMTVWEAAVLGILQGLTEFLPVSSSGHLVVGQHLFGIGVHDLEFDLAAHLGTLLAVFTVYRSSLWHIVLDLIESAKTRRSTSGLRATFLVIVASIPTAIIGFTFKDQFEALFSNISAVGWGFMVTAFLLFSLRFKQDSGNFFAKSEFGFPDISVPKALIIGLAQGLAITPGISRSGTTIATALLLGISKSSAAQFSFLIAIPAIVGASIFQLESADLWQTTNLHLWVGMGFAYGFGLLGLLGVLKAVTTGRMWLFSGYLLLLSLAIIFTQ